MPLVSHVIIPILSEDGQDVIKYRRVDLVDGSIAERSTVNKEWSLVSDDVTSDEMKWLSSYVVV